MLFSAKDREPFLNGFLLIVEGDDAIDDWTGVVTFFVDWLQTLAQRSLVGWRNSILHVIESHIWLSYFLDVDSTTISSTLNFSGRAVKPDNSIKTAFNQHLWGIFFAGWLDQKESILHLLVSLNGGKFFCRFVTTQGFFKKFCLSVAAGEINKYPSYRFSAL